MHRDDRSRHGGLLGFCLPVICCLFFVVSLSGCVDSAVEIGAPRPKAGASLPGGAPLISPHGASLALVSIEGPPDEIRARFQKQLASAAQSRDVALTESERQADYRLRGFLTASPAQGGTRLAYVLDVYDAKGRRVRRLTSEAGVAVAADPWQAVDEKSSRIFAERGAEELAAFLATTPEAIAAAGGEAGVSVVAAERAQGAKPASAKAASSQ